MKTIEFDEECAACKGTGLYVGRAERDGAAVVCHKCKGTGRFRFVHSYKAWCGRNERLDVARVFKCNPGIGIGNDSQNGILLEHFGGMNYTDWWVGMPFPVESEMRRFVCPLWWTQSAGSGDEREEFEKANCTHTLGRFADCRKFPEKDKCWEKWDAVLAARKGKDDG